MHRLGSRPWLALAALAFAALGLAACTVSITAGVISGVVSVLFVLVLAVGLGGTQTGCDDISAAPVDAKVGPCLSKPLDDSGVDAPIGPCLGVQLDGSSDGTPQDLAADAPWADSSADSALDAGVHDATPDAPIGPCLSPPLPDQGPDLHLGPCLSIALPPDAGNDSAVSARREVPAMDPLPQEGPQPAAAETDRPARTRRELLASLSDRLPADVVQRLERELNKKGAR